MDFVHIIGWLLVAGLSYAVLCGTDAAYPNPSRVVGQ